MEKIYNGGPAFVHPAFPFEDGLTKRDWFAGMALIALAECGFGMEVTAERAYKLADAMLLERDKVAK